ncbi:MAG: histidine kinase [Bacteroides sp.]|nr:histidine kinase [Roseburia sp.]MCM1347670.1 histidine kinase [Bacteroides sp.]MCM1421951.1 histidine kinase [Bacteroides sp.]
MMRNVTLYIDLVFCFVFLPLMIYIFPIERWVNTYPVFVCVFVSWLYATYFTNRHVVLPLLFRESRKKKRWWAAAIIAVSLIVTYYLSCVEVSSPLYHQHKHLYPQVIAKVRLNQQAIWLLYVVVEVFSFAVGMLTEINLQRLARKEMEYERNKAELAFYKAQINPHFLFNTLNTIYGMIITKSEKTEMAMEQFIDLTKYLYNNANKDFIPIDEEVRYINQYVELQKQRLNEFAEVSFRFRIAEHEMCVPPMILMTFVENAFKYGVSSNEPCYIHICLEQENGGIHFTVENKIFDNCARRSKDSKKTGIANCCKRLSLLYPGKHTLETSSEGGVFTVNLKFHNEP